MRIKQLLLAIVALFSICVSAEGVKVDLFKFEGHKVVVR